MCIYLLGSPISFCLKAFCFCFVCCVIGFFYYRLGLSKCLRDKRFILTSAKCIHQLLFSAASSTFEQSNQSGRSHRVFILFFSFHLSRVFLFNIEAQIGNVGRTKFLVVSFKKKKKILFNSFNKLVMDIFSFSIGTLWLLFEENFLENDPQ